MHAWQRHLGRITWLLAGVFVAGVPMAAVDGDSPEWQHFWQVIAVLRAYFGME